MKKLLSVMLVLVMLLTQFAIPSFADVADDEWVDPYEGLEVVNIEVEQIKPLYSEVDGYNAECYCEDHDHDEFFEYELYNDSFYYTVTYENGEIEEGTVYDLYGNFTIEDTQSETHWIMGEDYYMSVIYRNMQLVFTPEIAECPVASVTAVAQKPLVEGWDADLNMHFDESDETSPVSYWAYSLHNAEPVFTITMKDGTVVKGTDEEIYDQTGYWTFEAIDQFENPLKVGKNTVKFEYMGVECDCEIEITPNPYKGVSLKGENELYLVFEGVDEKDTYETKVIYAYLYDWNAEGDYYAEIGTDDGKYYDVVIYSDVDENGMGTLNKNVSIAIGPFVTSTLENCNFFKVSSDSERILNGAMEYYQVSEEISGNQFDGYNADEDANVNDLVALSTFINADYDNYQDKGDYGLFQLSNDEVEENIAEYFGAKDVNIQDSDFYRWLFRRFEVKLPWTTNWYFSDDELTFEDGKWVNTADVFNWDTEEMVGKITVVRNEDGTIYSIDLEKVEIQQGDVNYDGKVTAVDARLVLQYVAGIVEDYELRMVYADLNDDGNVTAVDARMILQIVAGLVE